VLDVQLAMTAPVIGQGKIQKQQFLVYSTGNQNTTRKKLENIYQPRDKNARPAFDLEMAKELCT
jgi:hypothetical protein